MFRSPRGLPFGLQLVARRYNDPLLLKFVAEAGKHKNDDGTPKVKPIVGCEFYVVADRHKKIFTREDKDKRFHQLMLAKNAQGYKNLSKLCSLGYMDGFYSKYPRIDKQLIEQYHEGLIATTCCLGASVPQAIMRAGDGDLSAAETEFKWMERFTETVENERLQAQLELALGGPKPFRRFKDALLASPSERQAWFTFRDRHVKEWIEQWFEMHDLAVGAPPDWKRPD